MKKVVFIIICSAIGFSLWMVVKSIAPYGEKYLPVWIEKGTAVVHTIEAFKKTHGVYPNTLPVIPDLKTIPGCRNISYIKKIDPNKTEYYVLRLFIHHREVVMYDSRKTLSEADSWGEYEIQNDWMWTKD